MTKDEALKMALDYLERHAIIDGIPARNAIREVLAQELFGNSEQLAQPEQEPVGRFAQFTDGIWREVTDGSAGQYLYTSPPKREWVGLTDEDLKLLSADWRIVYGAWMDDFAKDIEAKLKEKNT
jgi:hypothetical protein